MPRAKTGVVRRRRHKKVLKLTKGFRGTNNRLFKHANEALLHAGEYAYVGRKLRKRDMRKLWITRINGALKQFETGLNYSRFINGLKKAEISLNRKMLSEIAIQDEATFKTVVAKAKEAK